MRSCATFLLLLAANSVISDPNCAALAFNQIQSNQNLPNVLNPLGASKKYAKKLSKPVLRNCEISSCGTKKATDKGFYTIPEHEIRRKAWFDACGIPLTKKKTRICWRHFKPDQFRNKIDPSKGLFGCLKKDAFPTEFLPGEPIKVNSDSDFDLGRSEEIKIPEQISSAESVNLTKSDKEHDYAQNCPNPFDLIKKLKHQVQLLKNQNASLRSGNLPEAVKNRVVAEKLKGKFTPAQISQIISKKTKKRCMKWKEEDYNLGYKFRFLPKKQYNALRKKHNFPLPGISTIDKKFQFVHLSPGFIKPSLEFLKKKVLSLKESEKVIGICFDEIFIDNVVEIDQILDQAIGPAKNANVFWIRSISSNALKYPIFYELDHKLTKKELLEIIVTMEEIGFKVVSITCDQGIVCLCFLCIGYLLYKH